MNLLCGSQWCFFSLFIYLFFFCCFGRLHHRVLVQSQRTRVILVRHLLRGM